MEKKDGVYLPILNFLRAVASLSVCIVHFNYILGLEKYSFHRLLVLGQHGVSVFFVISGFVIPYSLWKYDYSLRKFFPFILRRSIRIDPPYLIIVLFSILLLGQFDSLKFIYHLFYLIPFSNKDWYQDIFWTLGIEFQFYLLIGLCFPLIKKGNIYLIVSFILILSCLGYFIKIDKSSGFIIHYLHYFGFGLLTLLIMKQRLSKLLGLLMLLGLTLYLCMKISNISGLVGLIPALTILYLNFQNNVINFLGKVSYSLYLTHSIVGGGLFFLLRPYVSNIYLLFTALLLGSILAAYIFYITVEKTALKWSKSIKI